MKVLFLGCLFNENEEKSLMSKSKIGLSGAVNTFQWSLIKGLDKNLSRPVDIINVLPVGTYPKCFKELILPTKRWTHSPRANNLEIGSLNLPFLKQIKRMIACKNALNKWFNDTDDDKSIIIYSTYLPFLYAVKNVPKNINVTLIVTDIPEFYDLTASNNPLKRFLRVIYNRLIYASLERIDSFILLTEQMKKPLNIGNKTYLVVEGLIDNDSSIYHNKIVNINKKIILYAGTLNFKFGIINLIDGFKLIDKKDYELWICGAGEAERKIIKASNSDDRIKYLGYVSKKEIHELQRKATLLINPRTNDGEYTEYSFPSKTMEYMVSGRPVLMYKLDGIPDEYDKYLYYINGNQPKDIANRIIEVCEKPQSELDEFGKKARRFVLENKNCIVQAKKIIEMIEKMNLK